MKLWKVTTIVCVSALMTASAAFAAELDPLKPRVPPADMAAAKADKNPKAATPDSIEYGKELFTELGCNGCHGDNGTGDGPAAAGLEPSPRNFTNAAWQDARTDGELKYTDFKGSQGPTFDAPTAMIANEAMYDEPEDVWDVINYIRSLKKGG
jgi:mono/diheme cytochrome c family protein